VWIDNITLPEFTRSRRVTSQRALIFENACPYDVILGRDFLHHTRIDVKFSNSTVLWEGIEVPMKPPLYWTQKTVFHTLLVDEDLDPYEACFASQILESKYEEVTPEAVATQQKHLTSLQQQQLAEVLHKFPALFDGTLGHYPHAKVHLEVDVSKPPPKFHKAYPVPRLHLETFKKELLRLVEIGVLSRVTGSSHCFPTFIIPKKDGRVRWVSDLRDLNKILTRRVYPLPNIMDILTRRPGYSFFSKLDISMQYYTFALDEESANLCVINTPFGLFRYNRLPMGVTVAPDFAQQIMDSIFRDLPEVDVYLDDVGIFNNDWDSHLTSLRLVLGLLEANGFTVNPLKCEWGVQETDWLGYWITPSGLKPWAKKIAAIQRMQPPTNITELRSFLGSVNYYRDMWPRRSHIMAPLTALTGKSQFHWSSAHQVAFEQLKALIAEDALLAYPDPNQPFHIYADASDYQLGAAILQAGRPIAYYTRKLSAAQRNYTTIEKELLSIVETFKTFRSLLYGNQSLHVYTDHRNLTFSTLHTQRVLRWRLFLEEFGPTFHYIKGSNNVLADALSRVPTLEEKNAPMSHEHDEFLGFTSALLNDTSILECYVNYPDPQVLAFPSFQFIWQHQQQDTELQAARQLHPSKYPIMNVGGVDLIVYLHAPNAPWRIAIPDQLLDHMIQWYHQSLNHSGMTNLFASISLHHYHRNLKERIETLIGTCEVCLRHKPLTRGYGHLPGRNAPLVPWDEVAVDLIGPWKIQIQNQEYLFHALTCIDPVTNLTELIRIDSKQSLHVTQLFANCWLSRYPRPNRCLHDNGGEFTGHPFQALLLHHNIKDVPTTVKNPQANAVCERMHKVVATLLRTLSQTHPIQDYHQAVNLIDTALAKAMHSLRATHNRTLGMSPGGLVFQRDMILDIPTIGDLHSIQRRRQLKIDDNLRRQNDRRFDFDYQVGGQVLLLTSDPTTLGPLTSGPYPIEQVHANGTLTIRRSPYFVERVNIRRVRPFHT
jgi:transposase InsO family protein